MNEQSIREVLSKRPFQPFEIVMSSGERHAVRHPENVLVSKSRLMIVNPESDTFEIISMLHITELAFPQAA